MTSAVNFQRDAQGQNTYAPSIDGSAWNNEFTLTANVEQHFTIPINSTPGWVVSIESTPGAEVWYAFTPPNLTPVTAVLPTGTPTFTQSKMNPGARTMPGQTYISVITSQSGVSVSFEGFYPPNVGFIA